MEKSFTNTETSDLANNSKCYLALGILIGLIMALGIVLASLFFPRVTKEFHDPNFYLLSISPSPFAVSTEIMPASVVQNPDNWNLTFLIKNPTNYHTFFYDDFDAKIIYNDTILWQANVSAKFYQDGKAQNFIDATFGALPEIYGDWMVDTILNDLASGHPTKFSLSLYGGKVQISHHDAQHGLNCRELHVFSEGLEVEFSRDTRFGMLVISSNTCELILRKLSC